MLNRMIMQFQITWIGKCLYTLLCSNIFQTSNCITLLEILIMKIVCIQISDAQIHCLVTGTGHFLIIFCIQMHKFTVWSREPVISSLFSVFRCTSALSGHGNRSFLHYFLYSDAQVHCLITGTGHFFIIFCIQMH